jgi:hypothetical protein
MAFNATWSPGPDAVAGMRITSMHTDQAALVIFLDPESLAIMAPGGPPTWPEFVRFLGQSAMALTSSRSFSNFGAGWPLNAAAKSKTTEGRRRRWRHGKREVRWLLALCARRMTS